jgi:hypothetical protein
LRHANPKKTASRVWITHDALNLIQTAPGNFSINMEKPEDVAACHSGTGIHLHGPIRRAYNNLIAQTSRKISRAIVAPTICNNNLRDRRPVTQMPKKWAYK